MGQSIGVGVGFNSIECSVDEHHINEMQNFLTERESYG